MNHEKSDNIDILNLIQFTDSYQKRVSQFGIND